jgi:hypothetical protein
MNQFLGPFSIRWESCRYKMQPILCQFDKSESTQRRGRQVNGYLMMICQMGGYIENADSLTACQEWLERLEDTEEGPVP